MNLIKKALLATTALFSMTTASDAQTVRFSGASDTGYNIKKGSLADIVNPGLSINYSFGRGFNQISLGNGSLKPMALEGRATHITPISKRNGIHRSWFQSAIIGNAYTPNDGYLTKNAAHESPNYSNPYFATGIGYSITNTKHAIKTQLQGATYVGLERHQQMRDNSLLARAEATEKLGINVGDGFMLGVFARQAVQLTGVTNEAGLTISWDAALAQHNKGRTKNKCPAFN